MADEPKTFAEYEEKAYPHKAPRDEIQWVVQRGIWRDSVVLVLHGRVIGELYPEESDIVDYLLTGRQVTFKEATWEEAQERSVDVNYIIDQVLSELVKESEHVDNEGT